jgi:hypothetical protein
VGKIEDYWSHNLPPNRDLAVTTYSLNSFDSIWFCRIIHVSMLKWMCEGSTLEMWFPFWRSGFRTEM